MPVTKICENCGGAFDVRPAKAYQRFCSKECQKTKRESAHIERDCIQCGSAFTITRFRERDRKFCSKTCVSAYEKVHGRIAARHERSERIAFNCQQCGKEFHFREGSLAEYRRKHDSDPKYCSLTCFGEAQKAKADLLHTVPCKNCGKLFTRTRRKTGGGIYREQALCSRQCKNEWVSKVYRVKHGLPEITRRIKRGYVELRIPAMDGSPVRFMLEHRYVMEQHLARPLRPGETVHHVNGDRSDNRIANLELFSDRHGPGQRVIDKIAFAIDMLRLYPEFAAEQGVKLVDIERSG